jgi:hypothetical protein
LAFGRSKWMGMENPEVRSIVLAYLARVRAARDDEVLAEAGLSGWRELVAIQRAIEAQRSLRRFLWCLGGVALIAVLVWFAA